MIVANRLGEQKEVTLTFNDGWYQCPFCMYPTQDPCKNPACEMNLNPISIKVERILREQIAKEQQQKIALAHAEIARREDKLRQNAILIREAVNEATARGACINLKCLFPRGYNGGVKYTKHRKGCPNGG